MQSTTQKTGSDSPTEKSPATGSSSKDKEAVDDELQFSLDDHEEKKTKEQKPSALNPAPPKESSNSDAPLVRLEPDTKDRFYPVPWKMPVMQDGKVCYILS